MTKPRGVKWLEEQTGEVLAKGPPATQGRHLSVRLSPETAARLERLAAERRETVSQVTRRLILEGLDRITAPEAEALDAAIAALQRLRMEMKPPAA